MELRAVDQLRWQRHLELPFAKRGWTNRCWRSHRSNWSHWSNRTHGFGRSRRSNWSHRSRQCDRTHRSQWSHRTNRCRRSHGGLGRSHGLYLYNGRNHLVGANRGQVCVCDLHWCWRWRWRWCLHQRVHRQAGRRWRRRRRCLCAGHVQRGGHCPVGKHNFNHGFCDGRFRWQRWFAGFRHFRCEWRQFLLRNMGLCRRRRRRQAGYFCGEWSWWRWRRHGQRRHLGVRHVRGCGWCARSLDSYCRGRWRRSGWTQRRGLR